MEGGQQRRLRLAALLLAGSVAAALVVGSLHMQVSRRAARRGGERGERARRNVGVHSEPRAGLCAVVREVCGGGQSSPP